MDWDKLGPVTNLLVHSLHYVSLLFMILAYAYKIYQLMQKPFAGEGTPARGDHDKSIKYAFMTLALPWEMESTSKHWFRYAEFCVFHLAMGLGIGIAFIMPWAHSLLGAGVIVYFMQLVFAVALLIGISRLLRRLADPAVRAISTPDDYFCIALLSAWMLTGIFMAPQTSEFWLFAFYFLATFFLFYVPFSKISHYVYWPFMRFYMGRHFGHRGVWPKKHAVTT